MTAAIARRVKAFLSGSGLFIGVLAIMAGIFGMHIMAGSHHLPIHAPAGVMGAEAGMLLPVVTTANIHSGHTTTSSDVAVSPTAAQPGASTASCLGAKSCPVVSSMHPACTPAPVNTSLDAPLPGTTGLALRTGAGPDHRAAWRYFPSSPSPGELCISRT